MTIGNVVDNLIELETNLCFLYEYFVEKFPEDAAFWTQLAEEENNHANLLENYKKFLPIEFQKLNKKLLIQTIEDIRKNLEDFKIFPPTSEKALSLAYLLENNVGEMHYQELISSSSNAETIRVFQILNFADKDHAQRINKHINEKKYDKNA